MSHSWETPLSFKGTAPWRDKRHKRLLNFKVQIVCTEMERRYEKKKKGPSAGVLSTGIGCGGLFLST